VEIKKSYTIFVGNIGTNTSEAMLIDIFGKYPSFKRAVVIRKKSSAIYAFVSFNDYVCAATAMLQEKGIDLGKGRLIIKKARRDF